MAPPKIPTRNEMNLLLRRVLGSGKDGFTVNDITQALKNLGYTTNAEDVTIGLKALQLIGFAQEYNGLWFLTKKPLKNLPNDATPLKKVVNLPPKEAEDNKLVQYEKFVEELVPGSAVTLPLEEGDKPADVVRILRAMARKRRMGIRGVNIGDNSVRFAVAALPLATPPPPDSQDNDLTIPVPEMVETHGFRGAGNALVATVTFVEGEVVFYAKEKAEVEVWEGSAPLLLSGHGGGRFNSESQVRVIVEREDKPPFTVEANHIRVLIDEI